MNWFRHLWVQDAQNDEQGSFCDTQSQIHYDNVGDFEKNRQVRDARDRGDEAVLIDDPYDGSDRQDGQPTIESRHTIWHTEKDGQGLDVPARHRVGER